MGKTEVMILSNFLQLEALLSKINEKYKLATIAAKRARFLNLGAEKKVDVKAKKNTTIALYEVALQKVEFSEPKK